ncbi:MAG: Fe-S cluster assembly protein SufD [Verrucomicrobiota bacterium]
MMQLHLEENKLSGNRGSVSATTSTLLNYQVQDSEAHSEFPQWWNDGAAKAWELFESMPMPSRRDEDWRFASIRTMDLEPYSVPGTDEVVDSDLPTPDLEFEGHACFVNEQEVRFEALPQSLTDQGVIWTTLADAVKNHPELIQKYFMQNEAELGSQKFAHLHRALVRSGTVLYVPKGVEIEKPLLVEYWIDGENVSVFPHTLIIAEENSSVTLMDLFRSKTELPAFACAVSDLHTGNGAKVSYLCSQQWSEQTLSIQLGATETGKDAHSKAFYFNTGGNFARLETVARCSGQGARSEVLGLSLVHGRQEFDQRTLQLHDVPNTWSDLLFKNSLNHRGKSIFSGLIRVAPGAKQTDAYQTNRNLLLDSNAEADSMPGLEIFNDDVKCSHGATTSQIDEEPLFYMAARGIPEYEAKHLIALGFCEELLERFDHNEFNEFLREQIEEKYARSSKLMLRGISKTSQEEDYTNVRQLQGTV